MAGRGLLDDFLWGGGVDVVVVIMGEPENGGVGVLPVGGPSDVRESAYGVELRDGGGPAGDGEGAADPVHAEEPM